MSRVAPTLVGLVLLLLLPAGASAGGWATVGVSGLPDGTPAGGTWTVDVEVLQHGRTPLEGVHPGVLLRGPGGDERRFAAVATGRPGIYRARVTFPRAGRFAYVIDDGFGQQHQLGSVTVAASAPPAAAATGGDRDWLAPVGAALAGLVAAAIAAAALRRRGPVPARA